MCGIAGWFSTRPDRFDEQAAAHLDAMRAALVHRGPDDHGDHFERPRAQGDVGCALGFQRLSIVDLEGGHQPMTNPDESVWVVFNGEIYNHTELRAELEAAGDRFRTRADTEVLVHGYARWGDHLIERLNGMFDLAIWRRDDRSLLLARDRMGQKPLYVAVADDGRSVLFGSELSALLAHPACGRDIDPASLRAMLLLDYVPSPRTILRGVYKLAPGESWQLKADDAGQIRIERSRYWRPLSPPPEPWTSSTAETLAELDRRIDRAVERRLMSDVPLGVFLSGGIDSSLIVAYAARHRDPASLDTFAIGFEDPSFDESAHARLVARHLGTRHHERTFDPAACLEVLPQLLDSLAEPLADPSILPTWFLSGFAREQVTVALGGDGGDELFLGYPTFEAHRYGRLFDRMGLAATLPALGWLAERLPVSERNWSFDYKLRRMIAGLALPPAVRHFVWIGSLEPAAHAGVLRREALEAPATNPDAAFADLCDVETWLGAQWSDLDSRARDDGDVLSWLYARTYLADGVLQKVDRASMLHSLEARAPLLDPEVVDLARRLPTAMKLRGRQTKWLLRELGRDLLPPSILARPKKGFGVPLAAWLRGPLRGWMIDLIGAEALADDPLLDPAGVGALIDAHLAGTADHRKVLWVLCCFAAWRRRLQGEAK